jgi:hypothetical protein
MTKIEVLTQKIEEIRTLMLEIMKEKSELVDPEVVEVSQLLDTLLNEYHNMISKK